MNPQRVTDDMLKRRSCKVLNERALDKDVGGIIRKQKVMVKLPELIRDMITFRLKRKGKRDCQDPGRCCWRCHPADRHLCCLNGGV